MLADHSFLNSDSFKKEVNGERKKPIDPYKHIRREIPPPGHPIGFGKEYNKNKYRKNKKKIIEEELEEYLDEFSENISTVANR